MTKCVTRKEDFITPMLVADLDRSQLSIRDSVYIHRAVVEALDFSCDDLPINKSSINALALRVEKIERNL